MAVPKGTSIGIDLSNPVRVAAYSADTGEVVAVHTGKVSFQYDSKQKIRELAGEIREFCSPLGKKLPAIVGLPMSDCLLFTLAMPKLSKKEFNKAIQFEIERLSPGGSDIMRAVVNEWPAGLPVPPSVQVPEGTKLYLIVAAKVEAVLSAQSLMKAAGLRPQGVDIPANSVSRACLWMWEKAKHLVEEDTSAAAPPVSAAPGSSEASADTSAQDSSSYQPWITHGNGVSVDAPSGARGIAATALEPDLGGESSLDDSGDSGSILDISIVAHTSEALMYLSYGGYPWMMREIPLDPDNPFVNGQILAGEITRSARFARASAGVRVDGRVIIIGESDRVSFLADYLKEQTGLRTRLWGHPVVNSDPQYGVAVGLALPQEGGAKS